MAWGRLGAILVCVRREEDDDRAAPPGSERERNRGVEGVSGWGGAGPRRGERWQWAEPRPAATDFFPFLLF